MKFFGLVVGQEGSDGVSMELFVLYLEFMLAFALLHSRDVLYLYINK